MHKSLEQYTKPVADFFIDSQSSVFVVIPRTDAAKAWIEEHVDMEDVQTWGNGIVVEHRFIQALVAGAQADDLTFVGE